MKKPGNRTILAVSVSAGALAFLFFGKASLAETFFFISSIVAIVAYFRQRRLSEEMEETKKRIAERFEELEHRLDTFEASEEKHS